MSFMADELRALKHNWYWFLALGIALVVAGFLAILMPYVAGIYATVLIGIFLLIGGVAQIIGSFQSRGWGAFFLQLLMGIIYVVTGLLMLEQPVEALFVLTVLVAVALLVGGLFRTLVSLMNHFPGWGWVLAGGIIDVILGLMIWRRLPESAIWVIGLFVGITMLYNGATWIALALSIHEVPAPPPAGAQPGPTASIPTP
jgi:uncharacterized membrane protein HdeD (DUF308 family)